MESDLERAHSALRRIVNVRPADHGPNNKNFGVQGIRALERTQQIAYKELAEFAQRDAEREHE